jgi:DNA-binding Xre family transcriptional regulator
MKLRIRIREVALSRGIKTAYKLQIKAKIAPSSAARLFRNNVTQMSISTLEKLCLALSCSPGDLIVRSDGKVKSGRGK